MKQEWIRSVVDALGWCLVHFLWQGAAIAAVVWVALRMISGSAPRVRYGISGAAMLAMSVAVLATFSFVFVPPEKPHSELTGQAPAHNTSPAPDSRATDQVADPAPATASPVAASLPTPDKGAEPADVADAPATSSRQPALSWLVGLWGIGVLFFSLRLLRSWSMARTLRRSGEPLVSSRLQTRFDTLCEQLRFSQPVLLLGSTCATVPMVIGWLRPVVLVPAGLLTGLPSEQLESILAHELAHIRRRDYLVNLLQTIVETLLFFHPAVWWVGAQLRRERENCCDDIAAEVSGGAVDYAEALLAIEGMRQRHGTPALGVAADGGSLLGRVRRLVAPDSEAVSRPVWPVLVGVLVSSIAAILAWSVMLDDSIAQEPDEGEVPEEVGEPQDDETVEKTEKEIEEEPPAVVEENVAEEKPTILVTDTESGAAIPRATVDLTDDTGTRKLVADEKGFITLPEQPDDWTATVRINFPGYISAPKHVTMSKLERIRKHDPAGLPFRLNALKRKVTKGRVIAPDGSPVAGAKVSVQIKINNDDTRQQLGLWVNTGSFVIVDLQPDWKIETETDELGRYQFTAPDAGELEKSHLFCQAEGYAPLELMNPISEDASWDLKLSPGTSVRVQVLDVEGKPLSGYSVLARAEYAESDPVSWISNIDLGVSDAEGYLPETGLLPRDYSIGPARKVWPDKLPETIRLDELEVPFRKQAVNVSKDRIKRVEISHKAVPDQLVQFDYEDRRPEGGKRDLAELRAGGVRLMNCDLGDGTERLCARVPDHLQKTNGIFVDKKDGKRKAYVRHISPDGDTVCLLRHPGGKETLLHDDNMLREPSPRGKTFYGTIVAEAASKITLRFLGSGGEQLSNFTDVNGKVSGRFGERAVRGYIYPEICVIENFFGGESVDFVIEHREFETVTFSIKDLLPGENRERDVQLVAKKPLLEVAVREDGGRGSVIQYQLLVGVPKPDTDGEGEDEITWYREATKPFASWGWKWILHKGYEKIKLKVEASGYESKTTGWIDGRLPRQPTIYLKLKRLPPEE